MRQRRLRYPFVMFSSPLIPPDFRLGLEALVFTFSFSGLRASRLLFCWPLAIGVSDQGAKCPAAGVGLMGGGVNVGGDCLWGGGGAGGAETSEVRGSVSPRRASRRDRK